MPACIRDVRIASESRVHIARRFVVSLKIAQQRCAMQQRRGITSRSDGPVEGAQRLAGAAERRQNLSLRAEGIRIIGLEHEDKAQAVERLLIAGQTLQNS